MTTFTTEQLLSFTKKRVKEIARELAIKGYTRMDHADLIDEIVELTAPTPEVEQVEPTGEPIQPFWSELPTPDECFHTVIALNNKIDVHRACNEFLDLLAEKHPNSVATISRKLTDYKKPFYDYQHKNPELNEAVTVGKDTRIQHIAGRLLTLSDEQKQVLGEQRQQADHARAGFDSEGDVREVDKAPIDIEAIVRKSLECLQSTDPHVIGCGIVNLTGLRAVEQNMPVMEYSEWGLIVRKMIVLDEFVIGFKGLSKKRTIEDTNIYFARATLAPAQLIVDAQERFLSSGSVQSIPIDYEGYRKGFKGTFYNRYRELFGTTLSTIEVHDDNGNIIKDNGTPHKGRAFYACALRAILDAKGLRDSATTTIIQQCLAHSNQAETNGYLARYAKKEFINPIVINIPTNIKEYGKMTSTLIEIQPATKEVQSTTNDVSETSTSTEKSFETIFNVDAFINGLDPDLQVKFNKALSDELNLTNALLSVVNAAKQKGMEDQTTTSTPTAQPKKPTVSDEIEKIVNAVMTYNGRQEINTNCAVPAYTLVSKIHEKVLGKAIAKTTFDTWMKTHADEINKQLVNCEIQGGLYNSLWNGKHHRKTMDAVQNNIITVYNTM